jgi:Predicted periplasmic protein
MKTHLLVLLTIFAFTFVSCKKNNGESQENTPEKVKGLVEITLDYEKQEGSGGNQWAIWIEDEKGDLVKTVFVTNFTADGGYIPRPACTPIWVSKAKERGSLNENKIDAYSGATPQTGVHTYVWDLTDEDNNAIEKGTYTFVVEATLLMESEAIFKGEVAIGGDKEITIHPEPKFTSDEERNKETIKSVVARYKPIK